MICLCTYLIILFIATFQLIVPFAFILLGHWYKIRMRYIAVHLTIHFTTTVYIFNKQKYVKTIKYGFEIERTISWESMMRHI